MAEPHRIVIIGGGAGGLELATRLGNHLGRRGLAKITLLKHERAHVSEPLDESLDHLPMHNGNAAMLPVQIIHVSQTGCTVCTNVRSPPNVRWTKIL